MDSFGIVDLLLFLGISQGVFLAITLSLVNNKNKLVGRVFYPRFSGALFFRVAGFVDTLIFIFGPLLYTYVRNSLVSFCSCFSSCRVF